MLKYLYKTEIDFSVEVKRMFFDLNNFNLEFISILNPSWESNNGASGICPYHALSYRVIGDAEFTHVNGVTHVASGDLIFVPAFYEYTMQAQTENLYVIHFHSNDPLPQNIKTFRSKTPQYFERKFRELYNAWSKKQHGYEYECKSILYRILLQIERELAESKFSGAEDRLLDAVEFIHDNLTSNSLSIELLAHMCGMSDTYFRRLFVKNFKTTPLKYINKLKLNYAKELLRSGYYTVSQVSEKCGFENIQYFSLFIKKETGKTPSQFLL